MMRLFPDLYVESVSDIDYKALYDNGVRALIFDIDNTLVPHGSCCTDDVRRLFERLHRIGFATLLLSNNSEARVADFAEGLNTLWIADADKPRPESFGRALKLLGVDAREAVVIGDTTFTDIAGANRAGIASILVKYIGYYKKEKKGIRRRIERMILACYPLVRPWRRRLI